MLETDVKIYIDEIRAVCDYILANKETLAKYPVQRIPDSKNVTSYVPDIEMGVKWLVAQVSKTRHYLSNSAVAGLKLERLHRIACTRSDPYEAVDQLCVHKPNLWWVKQTPRWLHEFLIFVEEWGPPPEPYDPRTHGPDGLPFAESDSKVGRIFRTSTDAPLIEVVIPPSPTAPISTPKNREAAEKQNAERAERDAMAKEAAIAEIKKELKRRQEDAEN
jgi:hypothetical protein